MVSKFIKQGTNKETCRNRGTSGNFGREEVNMDPPGRPSEVGVKVT